MADIFDYLAWRGDVPFSADPFNEVDNLVLSELAYTDFGGIVPGDGREVTIGEAYEAFFRAHTREELLAKTSYTARAPLLMEEMTRSARFRATRLCRYLSEIDRERDAQIAAVTFRTEDGFAYVAFRGTDGTLVGWKEDFDLTYLAETEGQRRAVRYLDAVGAEEPRPLRVGGHSKGGNFAVYAAAGCAPRVRERIETVYTNDGPGFQEETTRTQGYREILPRIVSIVPDTSVIGLQLTAGYDRRVVKSTASGLIQHDGFSWCVQRNRFERAALSETGKMIERALGTWLGGMDGETRRSFTETVFSLLEATGADTFSGMGGQKWKSAEAMLATMHGLPKEKQRELGHILAQLVQSGGQAALSHFAEQGKSGE